MEKEAQEMVLGSGGKAEIGKLLSCNKFTEKYGLTLTEKEAAELMVCRKKSLEKYRRVEFGSGILDKLVYAFCDSRYIDPDNYLEVLERLQDIFYEFKNETKDQVSDDELLTFMQEQFETVCMGDLDYLEETCLSRLAQAVRCGYRGYLSSQGRGEYEDLSEEQRWDKRLYYDALKDLF